MSYKDSLSDLERDGERSLTQQLVDLISAAIESGELAPGEQLPPTRELAELAGVNHLTAVRAYRRLRELGLVSAHVGRGTFVRGAAPPARDARGSATRSPGSATRCPSSSRATATRCSPRCTARRPPRELIPLSVGYPSERIFPVDARSARPPTRCCARSPGGRCSTPTSRACPSCASRSPSSRRTRGAPEDERDLVITNGASQALTLAARAIVRPGDVVACEDPSFMSVLAGAARPRRPGARRAGRRGRPRRRRARGAARPQRDPHARDPAAPAQPDRPRPRRRSDASGCWRWSAATASSCVEDGIYADLRFEGESPPRCAPRRPPTSIYCDSLSKTVGGGLRAGWVAASGPVLDRIVAEKRGDDIHSPTLTQLVVARYLAAGAYPAQAERARALLPRAPRRADELARVPSSAESRAGSEPLGGGHLWVHARPRRSTSASSPTRRCARASPTRPAAR